MLTITKSHSLHVISSKAKGQHNTKMNQWKLKYKYSLFLYTNIQRDRVFALAELLSQTFLLPRYNNQIMFQLDPCDLVQL